MCCQAVEIAPEINARIRRILGLKASRAFLYPVRPLPKSPVELCLVALYDESVSEPAEIFNEARLHQLLFHLRGAALRHAGSTSMDLNSNDRSNTEDDRSTATLAEVGQALTTALNLEDLSRLILEISVKLVGAHKGNIRLIEGQEEVSHYSLERKAQPKTNFGHLYVPIARHGRLKALLSLDRSSTKLPPSQG